LILTFGLAQRQQNDIIQHSSGIRRFNLSKGSRVTEEKDCEREVKK